MEQQIIVIYAKVIVKPGFLRDFYGVEVSASLISTGRILHEIKEWQSRVLKTVYAIVFMDDIV